LKWLAVIRNAAGLVCVGKGCEKRDFVDETAAAAGALKFSRGSVGCAITAKANYCRFESNDSNRAV